MPLLLVSIATCLPPEDVSLLYIWGLCTALSFCYGNPKDCFIVVVNFYLLYLFGNLNQFHKNCLRM